MPRRNLLLLRRVIPAMICIFLGWNASFAAEPPSDIDQLLDIPLSELMQMDVSLPSGIEENILDAPAAMVVITAEDIQNRGYTNLAEVIADLPGFDVVMANGTSYIFAYQRGYRTPFTQRTLLMIDGKVDNHLWTHEAVISRQYALSNVKKIEVLYGPASAVYGPNAFLGIINVVTDDGADLADGENSADVDHTGNINIFDITGLINYLYNSGADPVCP